MDLRRCRHRRRGRRRPNGAFLAATALLFSTVSCAARLPPQSLSSRSAAAAAAVRSGSPRVVFPRNVSGVYESLGWAQWRPDGRSVAGDGLVFGLSRSDGSAATGGDDGDGDGDDDDDDDEQRWWPPQRTWRAVVPGTRPFVPEAVWRGAAALWQRPDPMVSSSSQQPVSSASSPPPPVLPSSSSAFSSASSPSSSSSSSSSASGMLPAGAVLMRLRSAGGPHVLVDGGEEGGSSESPVDSGDVLPFDAVAGEVRLPGEDAPMAELQGVYVPRDGLLFAVLEPPAGASATLATRFTQQQLDDMHNATTSPQGGSSLLRRLPERGAPTWERILGGGLAEFTLDAEAPPGDVVDQLLRAEEKLFADHAKRLASAEDREAGAGRAGSLWQAVAAGAPRTLWVQFVSVPSSHNDAHAHRYDRTVPPPAMTPLQRAMMHYETGFPDADQPVLRARAVFNRGPGHAPQIAHLESAPLAWYFSKAVRLAAFLSAISLLDVFWMAQQYELAQASQAAAGRVSAKAVLMLGVCDGYLALMFHGVSLASRPLFEAFAVVAFLKLIGFALFQLRLLLAVTASNAHTPVEYDVEGAGGVDADHDDDDDDHDDDGGDGNNGDTDADSRRRRRRWAWARRAGRAVAEAGTPPQGMPAHRVAGHMLKLFYIAFLAASLLVWVLPVPVVHFLGALVAFGWGWAQIANNAWRGTTTAGGAFSAAFGTRTMLLRALVPLYVWLCPSNLARIPSSPGWAFTLLTLIALQLIVWHSQERRGPRWFLPAEMLPPKFDYAPRVPRASYGDCAVCLEPVGEPEPTAEDVVHATGTKGVLTTAENDGGDNGNVKGGNDFGAGDTGAERDNEHGLRQRASAAAGTSPAADIAVAPCRHAFHRACLERWQNESLSCPVCRRAMPPVL